MHEPPLTDRELRIVRGMIDEHLYRQARSKFLGESWRDSRAVLAVLGAGVLFGVQVVTLIVAIRGNR